MYHPLHPLPPSGFSVYVALTNIPVGELLTGFVCDFCTVFGFSLFGCVGVNPGISQWLRVGDAGALRAEPLATLYLARS